MRFASEPFAPGHVMFERSILACLLCNSFSFGTRLATTYYLPLYWQAVEDISATQAGLRFLSGIMASVSGSLFAGLVMKKTGRYYLLIVTYYTGFMIGGVPIILFTGLVNESFVGHLAWYSAFRICLRYRRHEYFGCVGYVSIHVATSSCMGQCTCAYY